MPLGQWMVDSYTCLLTNVVCFALARMMPLDSSILMAHLFQLYVHVETWVLLLLVICWLVHGHISDIVAKAYHHRANMIQLLFCFITTCHPTSLCFTTYVQRPLLEYNCVIWSPLFKQDIALLELVQRRFTKRLCGFRAWSALSWTSLFIKLTVTRSSKTPFWSKVLQ